jgi:Domain of unknown function (DUF4268)
MPIYRVSATSIAKVAETTFAEEKLLERGDLQRLLKADISVLSPDLMVIADEYGEWEDSKRRIDLLCLDKQSCLVVIELKRTEDGGHMELQAIRYAAMVSSMTFDQLVDAHARFIGGDEAHQKAEFAILSFLGWDSPSDGSLSDEVKIILVAANFSIELTTAVLWLNKRDLDITCIRLKPYRLDGHILLDVQQIIPLPEAAVYETKIRAQQQESRRAKTARHEIFRRFWAQLIERSRGKTSVIANRSTTSDHWLSGGIGRAGFGLNFVLRQDESQVECYIDFGKGADDRNLAALRTLEQQKTEIEASFGEPLDWQELEQSRGCRICKVLEGGWKTPEADWPALQDCLIDTMVRLEKALRNPIRDLKVG